MKPLNENSECTKCGYDSEAKFKYWDGCRWPHPIMGLSDKKYKKDQETAHERECIMRECSRCGYEWEESVLNKESNEKT